MDKFLKVALMLTAVDKMSSVVASAVGKSKEQLSQLKATGKTIADGFLAFDAGKKGFAALKPAIDEFGRMEYAGNRLKTSLMKDGGILDAKVYDAMVLKAQHLGSTYANTSADYLDMFRVLKNNGIETVDILGQVGEATEMLAVALDTAPAETAEFAARMKRDMGIANKDMMGMMDLIARMHNVGVGKTGSETVNEMNQFFSKEGLSATIMQALGLEQSKQVAAIGALFMRRGLSGQTVGTNFRRMLDTMRNPKAMQEVQDQAKSYGIALDLFDKDHKFKGFANLVAEFDKLKHLDVQAIDKITHAFGGRQGLSNDFIGLLAKEGVKDFNEVMHDLYTQATITQKVNVLIGGQQYQTKQLSSAWKNIKANFGANLSPMFNAFQGMLKSVIQSMDKFIQQHPKLAKFIGLFVAIMSAASMLYGIVTIIRGVIAVMRILNITLMANPFILMATVAIAAVALIITYWSEIKGFFVGLWDGIKNIFFKAWDWFKNSIFIYFAPPLLIFKHWDKVSAFFKSLWDLTKAIFQAAFVILKMLILNFTPVGLIFKHWATIASFFTKIWNAAKAPFVAIFRWVWDFGSKFADAGKHILDSIIDGIMKRVDAVTTAIKGVAKKIRDHFPFSPAKEGPLRDIHRIRLIETIAESIKPAALINKMRSVTGQIFDLRPQMPNVAAQTMGGGGMAPIQISMNIQYHAAPGGTAQQSQDFLNFIKSNSRQIVAAIKDEMERQGRKSFM